MVHRFNKEADRLLLRPVTQVYRGVVPVAGRRGIGSLHDNLGEPLNATNALMQGKVKSSFRAVDRFLINGLLGLGLADHASQLGLYEEPHDFGQTLAVWGVPSGPFLMLPFLGPATVRDGVGFAVDFFADPVELAEDRILTSTQNLVGLGIRIIDIRSGLMDQGEQLLTGAADEYAVMRSAWLQLRRNELHDGMPPPSAEELEEEEAYLQEAEENSAEETTPSPAPLAEPPQ